MNLNKKKQIIIGIMGLMVAGGTITTYQINANQSNVKPVIEENANSLMRASIPQSEESLNDLVEQQNAILPASFMLEERNLIEAPESSLEEKDSSEESGKKEKSQEVNDENEKNKEDSKKEESDKENIIIAKVDNYVNIRKRPNLEGKIVGKLYDDSVGTLIKKSGDWYKIKSGSVTGYVKGEYVLTGNKAVKAAEEAGQRMAVVTTTTLKVRKKASTESPVIGLVPEGDILTVSKEKEGWVRVSVEEGDGYVSTDYVDVYTQNVYAESIQEEKMRLKKEEEERRKAREAAMQAVASENNSGSNSQSSSSSQRPSQGSQTSRPQSSVGSGQVQSPSSQPGSSLGQRIANYAVQFVGNPYVYGGTSLTNGADCSGFVMSVYKKFGISLPRTSGQQGRTGTNVGGIQNARPGDLISYSGHIGIYIGNNKLVHASSPRTGIIISNVNYRPILSVRRIV